MFRIVKTHYFDMAHRIPRHGGACKQIHGHTYMVEVSLVSEELNGLGMVLDFGDLKRKFFAWIDQQFDHTCHLSDEDCRAIESERHVSCQGSAQTDSHSAVDHLNASLSIRGSIEFFPEDVYATAEGMAKYFYGEATQRLISASSHASMKVDYVRVYEQLHPTVSYAEYSE